MNHHVKIKKQKPEKRKNDFGFFILLLRKHEMMCKYCKPGKCSHLGAFYLQFEEEFRKGGSIYRNRTPETVGLAVQLHQQFLSKKRIAKRLSQFEEELMSVIWKPDSKMMKYETNLIFD